MVCGPAWAVGRDRIADNIGMDRGAVENWFYGNNLPSLSGWVARYVPWRAGRGPGRTEG